MLTLKCLILRYSNSSAPAPTPHLCRGTDDKCLACQRPRLRACVSGRLTRRQCLRRPSQSAQPWDSRWSCWQPKYLVESSRVEAAAQGQGDNGACVPSTRQGHAPTLMWGAGEGRGWGDRLMLCIFKLSPSLQGDSGLGQEQNLQSKEGLELNAVFTLQMQLLRLLAFTCVPRACDTL